jgi:para-aminobenzoate synthetase component 1
MIHNPNPESRIPNPIAPVIEKFSTYLSPLDVFEAIHEEPFSFFLDSAAVRERLGTYSFLGYDPFLVMRVMGNEIEVSRDGEIYRFQGDPFVLLKDLLSFFPLVSQPGMPPFTGGVVGYFGYDLGRLIEIIPCVATEDLAIPDAFLAFSIR